MTAPTRQSIREGLARTCFERNGFSDWPSAPRAPWLGLADEILAYLDSEGVTLARWDDAALHHRTSVAGTRILVPIAESAAVPTKEEQ